jgi:3-hydroxyisobutyrate dehydrogenase-like beta-hydroxyacid dehydrogenase
MAVKTVGLLSPGDMGHTTGDVLRKNGLRVLTCLRGRSERTRALAAEAGFEDRPDLETLVRESDMLLCILVPSEALGVARAVADAVRATGTDLLYVECNAISPGTTREIERVITASGARYADAGIIGPPPARPGTTRFYTSGTGAEEFAQLAHYGLDVRVLPGEAGQASGIKMCFAALTKGLQALGVELLIAARALGVEEALKAEHAVTMASTIKWLQGATPRMPPKAYRWVGEMEEIAATFEQLGMTPKILLGAADMYRFIADTPLGAETPENRDRDRDLYDVVAGLAEALEARTAARA